MRKEQGLTQSVTERLNPQIFERHNIYQVYLLIVTKNKPRDSEQIMLILIQNQKRDHTRILHALKKIS